MALRWPLLHRLRTPLSLLLISYGSLLRLPGLKSVPKSVSCRLESVVLRFESDSVPSDALPTIAVHQHHCLYS